MHVTVAYVRSAELRNVRILNELASERTSGEISGGWMNDEIANDHEKEIEGVFFEVASETEKEREWDRERKREWESDWEKREWKRVSHNDRLMHFYLMAGFIFARKW